MLPKRRLVLLGKTGVGKSASGNTILGSSVFRSEGSLNSVTAKLEVQQAVVAERLVSVVDTPGLFDTDLTEEEIVFDLARSIYECSPGPHALLIVVPLNVRFTQQEKQVTDIIRAFYGEDALKYTIILFTFGDNLNGNPEEADKSLKEHIKKNKALCSLVKECGGRYHVLNNKGNTDKQQVNELLDKIDVMAEQNGGSYYSNKMLQDAMRCRAEQAVMAYIKQSYRAEQAVMANRKQKEREDLEEQQRKEEIERAVKEAEDRIKAEYGIVPTDKKTPTLQGDVTALRNIEDNEPGTNGPGEEEGFWAFLKKCWDDFVEAAAKLGMRIAENISEWRNRPTEPSEQEKSNEDKDKVD